MSSLQLQEQSALTTDVSTSTNGLPDDEEIAGKFRATTRQPLLITLLLGALSSLLSSVYTISVADKKIYFTKISIWTSKPEGTDAFSYDEIEKATLKTGMFLSSLNIRFKNGNKLKLRVFYRKQKPAKNNTLLDAELFQYLKDRLPCIPY